VALSHGSPPTKSISVTPITTGRGPSAIGSRSRLTIFGLLAMGLGAGAASTNVLTGGEQESMLSSRYMFEFTASKCATDVQLQEVRLYSAGERVELITAASPGGASPDAVIDGDVAGCTSTCSTYEVGSKWVAQVKNPGDTATTLLVEVAEEVHADAYDFITADNNPCRDPVSWSMYRWHQSCWLHLTQEMDVITPSERFTSYGIRYLYSPPPTSPLHPRINSKPPTSMMECECSS